MVVKHGWKRVRRPSRNERADRRVCCGKRGRLLIAEVVRSIVALVVGV